jgi:hypothetical protein
VEREANTGLGFGWRGGVAEGKGEGDGGPQADRRRRGGRTGSGEKGRPSFCLDFVLFRSIDFGIFGYLVANKTPAQMPMTKSRLDAVECDNVISRCHYNAHIVH